VTIQEHLNYQQVDDENLSFLKAIGVDYVSIHWAEDMSDGVDRTDYLKDMRRLVESHGLKLNSIAQQGWDSITMGLPDRDQKIEAWRTMLKGLGRVGIPTLGYNFKPVGNFRTESVPIGRGDARYSTFDYDEYSRTPPLNRTKEINEERMWANMEHFLRHVVPAAEDAGVRMALHPDDPPIPEAMCGAARIVSTLDQYQRIFDLVPSDSNAMLFCQGCVAEMGEDVPSAIRRIAAQKKIVYVHFRNIRAGGSERIGQGTPVRKFQEVFLDEGDVDMMQAMQTYKDAGFNGPFMMDHTPHLPQEPTGRAGRAFAVGYIRAMIQAVYR
jgi:mannonate dehydratase